MRRKDGNPFNTTIIPVSPPDQPKTPTTTSFLLFGFGVRHGIENNGPSASQGPSTAESTNFWKTKKSFWAAIVAAFVLISFGILFFMLKCCKGKQRGDKFSKSHKMGASNARMGKSDDNSQNVTEKGEIGDEGNHCCSADEKMTCHGSVELIALHLPMLYSLLENSLCEDESLCISAEGVPVCTYPFRFCMRITMYYAPMTKRRITGKIEQQKGKKHRPRDTIVVYLLQDDAGRLVRIEKLSTKDITHRVKFKNYWQVRQCRFKFTISKSFLSSRQRHEMLVGHYHGFHQLIQAVTVDQAL
ncbi:hypothetical protein IFM89_013646 [Coptis chinensis]|uniref:Uncharacterized protein n=1 Tax=Coptis chinensis TaxID=261450 RepID=A0A835M632_9MAGN|nr:hypothetical protein IFM89_013646 [Coptis chinensis]